MLFAAVFLVSLSSLAVEVLLVRAFSISQFNHLSFMVISIALFGFAASGTFLSILDTRIRNWEKRLTSGRSVKTILILYTLTAVFAFTVVNRLPLDYFRLPLESIQAGYLMLAYFLLALPFFFAGLIISLAYTAFPEKTGTAYLATMTGSAAGAVIPALFLSMLGEGRLIILVSLVPIILLPWGQIDSQARTNCKRSQTNAVAGAQKFLLPAAGVMSILMAVAVFLSPLADVRASPYKALSRVLRFPGTRIVHTVNGLRGRVDHVAGPYFRFAPGLSLKYTRILPPQETAYTDGRNGFFLYHFKSGKAVQFPRYCLPFAGYRLVPKPRNVLLIQHGGGSSIPAAMASGARDITIVAQHPRIAGIMASHYKLSVVTENPRAFLAGSGKRYDIIQVESWGASVAGAAALDQEYLLTTPAFVQYLNHLTARGVLIISRKLLLPPSDAIRLWGAARQGLKMSGYSEPAHHMALLRNWDVFTLIVSAKPLGNAAALKDFARSLNFDVVFLPGIEENLVNRFNRFDRPFHFNEIRRLAEAYRKGEERKYYQSYFLDVRPQTDDRPFPGRFLKWTRIKSLYQSVGSRIYALLMSGEIVVVVVFVEALVLSFLLLICPLAAARGKGKGAGASRVFYFLSVGAGFMFLELYFIKSYTLFFGDPVISLTVVLCGMLVFSGIGGYLSGKMADRSLRFYLAFLVVLLVVFLFGLKQLAPWILTASVKLRYLLAWILLAPAGIMAGMPFPLGMRHLLTAPVHRAYAWSANGCASVLAAIASAQIAVSFGISALLVCALAGYLTAMVCASRP